MKENKLKEYVSVIDTFHTIERLIQSLSNATFQEFYKSTESFIDIFSKLRRILAIQRRPL